MLRIEERQGRAREPGKNCIRTMGSSKQQAFLEGLLCASHCGEGGTKDSREKTGLSGFLAHANGRAVVGKTSGSNHLRGSWAVSLLCVGLIFRLALYHCSLIVPLGTRIYQRE